MRLPKILFFVLVLATVGVGLYARRELARAQAAVADSSPGSITIGPYACDVTPTSAIIRWATALPADKAADNPTQPPIEFHEKKLTGLQPSTVCAYDVLGGATEGKGSVTTFPDGPHPFRFVAYGDTRTRNEVHQKIVNRVIAEKPLFIINTGDLVSDGTRFSLWEQFFQINRELLRASTYIAVQGNHEKNAKSFFDFFRRSDTERYYCLKVGDVLFLILDSEAPDASSATIARQLYMSKQKEWVEKTLQENKSTGFVFACFHKPMYTLMSSRKEDTAVRKAFWGDIFERNSVQVVLCGHDHHYHHAVHNGTLYITTGGGGAPLYKIDDIQPETVKSAMIEHYLTLDVGLDKIDVKAIDINGNLIDHFDIPKRKV